MRDLLFKNLTSESNGRKILCSSEISEKEGVRTVVRRHFVYFVRQLEQKPAEEDKPYLYVLKEHNTRQKLERFYCRMKGSMVVLKNGHLFKINFMHSLRINLCETPAAGIA